jgi:hypothetical protein
MIFKLGFAFLHELIVFLITQVLPSIIQLTSEFCKALIIFTITDRMGPHFGAPVSGSSLLDIIRYNKDMFHY